MSDTEARGWHCPGCGRRVPSLVETCRCGVGRPPAPPVPAESLPSRVGRLALGYTPAAGLPSPRSAAAIFLIAAAAGALVYAGTLAFAGDERIVRAEDVRVVARLDEYTRGTDPGVADTIPEFLALPGTLGALIENAPGTVTLQAVAPIELRKGLCTASLARLVRHMYPGTYDDLTDADLEQRLLAARPEYRDRVCALPAWVPRPREIVKYEVVPRPALALSGRGLGWAAFAMLLFGVVALNAYYRLAVPEPVAVTSANVPTHGQAAN
jgi:hypothetical protein